MTDPNQGMAEKTKELLKYIIDFHAKNHYGPSFRTILNDLGWSTTSLVDHHITQLELRGLVTRIPHYPHSLKPTQLGQATKL